jgi:hypothetical protein
MVVELLLLLLLALLLLLLLLLSLRGLHASAVFSQPALDVVRSRRRDPAVASTSVAAATTTTTTTTITTTTITTTTTTSTRVASSTSTPADVAECSSAELGVVQAETGGGQRRHGLRVRLGATRHVGEALHQRSLQHKRSLHTCHHRSRRQRCPPRTIRFAVASVPCGGRSGSVAVAVVTAAAAAAAAAAASAGLRDSKGHASVLQRGPRHAEARQQTELALEGGADGPEVSAVLQAHTDQPQRACHSDCWVSQAGRGGGGGGGGVAATVAAAAPANAAPRAARAVGTSGGRPRVSRGW